MIRVLLSFVLLISFPSWAEEGSDELVFPFEVYPKVLEPNARIGQSTIVYQLCNDDNDNSFSKIHSNLQRLEKEKN